MLKRNLEYFETLLYFAHQKGMSQMTVWLELEGDITQASCVQSLEAVFNKHPLLRSRVVGKNDALCFLCDLAFDDIPISFQQQSSPSAQEKITDVANAQIDLSQHNWSVDILHNGNTWDFVFHFSHVVADGLSMVNVTQEFAHSLDSEHSLGTLPLHSGCEQNLVDKIAISDWPEKTFNNLFQPIEPGKSSPSHPQNLKPFESFTLDSASLKKLEAKARSQGVSVNSAMMAAYILSYWEINEKSFDLALGSALSLRNKCTPKIPRDICGDYFSPIYTPIIENDAGHNLWSMAVYYHRQLGQVISNQKFLPTDYNYKEMTETLKTSMMHGREEKYLEPLGSSFMGKITFHTKNILVKEFFIRPKFSGQLNLVSFVFNDELKMMLCYPPLYRSPDWIKAFCRLIKDRLAV